MPIHRVAGGWRWGQSGKTYKTRALAERQARAIYASGYRGDAAPSSGYGGDALPPYEWPATVEVGGRTYLVDHSHDQPYLAGSSRDGGTLYFDRDWDPRKLVDGRMMDRLPTVALHEVEEKRGEDEGLDYTDAHRHRGEAAERRAVEDAGHTWEAYQDSFAEELKRCALKVDPRLPPDEEMLPFEHPHSRLQRRILSEAQMAADARGRVRLRAPGPEPVVLQSVKPDLGLQAAYRRRIMALVDEMQASVMRWVPAAYRADPPEMEGLAGDASPARTLDAAMKKLAARWLRRFDDAAPKLARYFADGAADRADRRLKKILRDGGFTVRFDPTRATNDVTQATVAENVQLIRSIPRQYMTEVQGLVMRSVAAGRDLSSLTGELQKRYGVTARRAALIARDQNQKATAAMSRTRRLELGITHAVWQHSGAGAHPRPSHVRAGKERLVYEVAKGALIDGEYIQPGELINCRCTSRPVIPGLED